MVGEADNAVLVMLRRMDEKLNRIDTKMDRVIDDLHDVKVRLSHVGQGLCLAGSTPGFAE